MAKGIVILFIAGCHAGFYLMADYGLWWVLRMMKTQLMQKTNKAGRLLEIKTKNLLYFFIPKKKNNNNKKNRKN